MRPWLIGTTLAFLSGTAMAQSAKPNPVDIAMRYIAAQEAVMEKGAGPRDVETLISFYSPDYTYFHPQFGAKVTGLETVRTGITSHLGETANARIVIRGILTNGDIVALALKESFVDAATGKHIERDRTTALTIKDGKVVQRVDM